MFTFYIIYKQELDFDGDVKSQLDSLAQQISEVGEEYHFLPHEEYKDTFLWVLETNSIPYQLLRASTHQ